MSKEQVVALFFYVWGYLLIGLILGAVSKKIGEGKGYANQFWWGFLLGIIGVIVVAVRPVMNQQGEVKQAPQGMDSQNAENVATQLQ